MTRGRADGGPQRPKSRTIPDRRGKTRARVCADLKPSGQAWLLVQTFPTSPVPLRCRWPVQSSAPASRLGQAWRGQTGLGQTRLGQTGLPLAAGSRATGGSGDAVSPGAAPGRTGVVLSRRNSNRLVPVRPPAVVRQTAARFAATDRKNGALFPKAARPPVHRYRAQMVPVAGSAARWRRCSRVP